MPDVAAPLRHTQFPARVVGPDRTLDRVRALITIDGLFVYGVPAGGPSRVVKTVLAVDPYTDIRHDGRDWIVVDENGGEWRVTRGAGCGCSSPLKRLEANPPKYLGVEPEDVRV